MNAKKWQRNQITDTAADVKLLKVETWWKKAHDRNIWGRIIKEAKVHKRLYSQRKKKKTQQWQ